jgi:hypothetical protein
MSMSLIKDVYEDSKGYTLRYRILSYVSPKKWLRHHKWRKQRADRGWSDRDTWGAGDHIAKMTAEMLQHLNDFSMCSWSDWFDLNVKEKGKNSYKDLQSIIDDINNYLTSTESSWADGLTTRGGVIDSESRFNPSWYDKTTDEKLTDVEIGRRIKKWSKEEKTLYEKAIKAMSFFARHFSGFWD